MRWLVGLLELTATGCGPTLAPDVHVLFETRRIFSRDATPPPDDAPGRSSDTGTGRITPSRRDPALPFAG